MCALFLSIFLGALQDYPSQPQITIIMKRVHEFTRRLHAVSDKFRDMDIPSEERFSYIKSIMLRNAFQRQN